MGVGHPLEAEARLTGPIRAGTWHLVGDGIVLYSVDITYDVLWRDAAGDHPIVRFQHHFDPLPSGPGQFDATPFDASAPGVEAPARDGDRLVLRFTAENEAMPMPFIPNGDGKNAKGRIPSIRLP